MAFIASCTKNADNIPLPNSDAKLVVGCFISPQDSFIVVTLTRSNPIFGKSQNYSSQPTDATVIISSGSSSMKIPYNGSTGYELAASLFPIIAGTNYQLKISTPQNEMVTANCTVPISAIPSFQIQEDSINLTVNIKWQDIPNQANYYKVMGYQFKKNRFQTGRQDTLYDLTHNEVMYGGSKRNTLNLINDQDKDGGQFKVEFKVASFLYYPDPSNSFIRGFDFCLMNLSHELYTYIYSLDNAYNDGNPFSEPSPVYSNINGGLGIFAAFQRTYIKTRKN